MSIFTDDQVRRRAELPVIFIAILLIIVADAQNQPPVCTPRKLTRFITEGVPVGTVVLDFKDFCSDPERGPLRYEIFNNAIHQFVVDDSAQLLKTRKRADAEAVLNHAPKFFASPWVLRIGVYDNTSASFFMNVNVFFNSTNDNPAMMKNLVASDVREDALLGTNVGGCTLVDGDFPGSGHDIPYVEIISGNEDKNFAVDSRSCDIILVGFLDYESRQSYSLTFRAYNFPGDPSATTQILNIKVIDVNDMAPTCSSYNIIMDVPEDKVANDVLLKLNCTDADMGEGGKLEFSGVRQSTYCPLKVDEQSGEIILTSDLDFDADSAKRNTEIVVKVTDKGIPRRSASVTIYLRVVDVDDQPPEFFQSVFSANIPENTDPGHIVLTLSATDKDSPHTPFSMITYGFETSGCQNWFELVNITGAIWVHKLLDWETEPVISCLIYAYSSDKYSNRSVASLVIYLQDVNDRAPSFSQISYRCSVAENAPPFTSVLTVSATDIENGTNGEFTYSLPNASSFAVDPDTGVVYVSPTGVIDYETATYFLLTVVATDKGDPPLASHALVHVEIEPVNEFTPDFISLTDIHVSELARPGTSVTKLLASDMDAGSDGEVEFFLQDSNVPFTLEKTSGELWVAFEGLDYEKSQFYSLDLVAADKSQSVVKSSTQNLRIIIDNENECDPICEAVGPVLVTANSVNIEDPIAQLNCTDTDLGTSLRHDIVGGNSNNLFRVSPNNGTVSFSRNPEQGIFLLMIGVSDQGAPERVTKVLVQIHVETELRFVNLPERISVSESTRATSSIFTVTVKGAYQAPNLEIISGNNEAKFSLDPRKGELMLVTRLDREIKDLYNLVIKASTINGQSVKEMLTINVNDYNDNIPTYDVPFDHIKVFESQTVPHPIKQYTATDLDNGANAEMTYSILSGDPENTFDYDDKGTLKLRSALHRVSKPSYTLHLGVSDRGTPPLNSSMIVCLEVTAGNQNKPVIASFNGTIQVTVSEDCQIGASIIQINVQNNVSRSDFRFSIISGNDGHNFTINENTGVVSLVHSLDINAARSLSLGIRVSNAEGKTDEAMLVISIDDDGCPIFAPDNYVFSVPYGTTAGDIVGTLTLTDADGNTSGDFSLSVISGDPNGTFSFNGSTLISLALLDADNHPYHGLTVHATKKVKQTCSSTAYVTVLSQPKVMEPLFCPRTASVSLEETQAPGRLLYDTNATCNGARERSENRSGDLVYFLNSGDLGIFFLDSETGKVTVVGALEYNTASSHSLVIRAANRRNLSLTDSVTLTVTVIQVNKHPPVFSTDFYTWDVMENAGIGTVVGQVTATDKDLAQFGDVTYTLKPNHTFIVHAVTGAITVNSALEYTHDKCYSLVVAAVDNAGINSRTASAVVFITVIDINNHAPVFTNASYVANVPETLPVGTVILVLVAVDFDSGASGTVTYSIISGNDYGIFSINSSNGALSVNSALDYETTPIHTLVVQGADCGAPPLYSTSTVTVIIHDHNDNIPNFGLSRLDLAVRRDTPPLTSVCQLSATDNDKGVNGIINYIIRDSNSDSLFSIDTNSGVIATVKSLTSGDGIHSLTVLGIDQGLHPLTGTITVVITLTPVVCHAKADYSFTVAENEIAGTLVGAIPADPAVSRNSTYTITGGNFEGAFEISTSPNMTGVLRTTRELDRETYSCFQLQVSVKHARGTNVINVTVDVLDKNDNAPEFTERTMKISVVENLPAGYAAGKLVVSDADERGANSEVDFHIPPSSSKGRTYFTVEPSGIIRLITPINYETISFIKFEVIARDKGTPSLDSTATVMVNVVDVKDDPEKKHVRTTYYVSYEFPDDATEGEVCMLKPADVGLKPGPGDLVSFTTVGTDSVFHVHQSTGAMLIARSSSIFESARYLQWVVISVNSSHVTDSRALLVRLDTFSKARHLISMKVDTDLSDLRSKIESLRQKVQSFYPPPQAVRVYKTQAVTAGTRRKLQNAVSEALMYVVSDEAADEMANILMTKTFLSKQEAVKPLQSSPGGSPVQILASFSPPVVSVLPYSEEVESGGVDSAFVAGIVLACITGLILVAGIVALSVYCTISKKPSKNDDRGQLGPKISETSTDSSIFTPSRKSSHIDRKSVVSSGNLQLNVLPWTQENSDRVTNSAESKVTDSKESDSGILATPSDLHSTSSFLDDVSSSGTFRASAIFVSTPNTFLTIPGSDGQRSRKSSSTCLTSLESDALDTTGEDVSVL